MFGLTQYLPRLAVPGSSHEPRRHPPPERETPRGGGQLPARAAAQTRRLHHTVQPSQASEHHEEAGAGNETQQQTLNCLTTIAWILSDSSTKHPRRRAPRCASKHFVGNRKSEKCSDHFSRPAAWGHLVLFEGELSHVFFVCFITWLRLQKGRSQIAARQGDVTGRCETELTRIPELSLTSVWHVDAAKLLLEDLRPKHLDRPLVAGCIPSVWGDSCSCLLMSAVGYQAALWVKAVRGLKKED